ncbi:MAG: folylpolyglutamate synthase/dihydrofolate synthase family protein [Eubacteriales bacterium]|nr:folylpolyglutamate synthase/dihydrofolate synthase family protein [Eubacteriales bacterium]
MNYEETLNKIHTLNKFGSRPGLDRILMLLEMMGNPQDSLRFVHVAGTNGKGSVCQMLSSVLSVSGYRTGLFISPYITDFRERIQLDNEPISKEDLCETAEYVFSLVEKLNARDIIITEFEFVMAVSFEYFRRQNADVVVCETGLGGLLDCTNVIKPPLCAVLTKIGFDHTNILGGTLTDIATQKCGIIKIGSSVVSDLQREEAKAVIDSTCENLNVPLIFARGKNIEVISSNLTGTEFTYKDKKYKITLLGEHQTQNAAVAIETVNVLREKGYDISEENLLVGLAQAKNPARQEIMREKPLILLDGAHNADGMSTFAKGIRALCKDKKPLLIMGMLADKDSKASLEYIKGEFQQVFTVPINNPRAMKSQDMAKLCEEYFDSVKAFQSLREALYEALRISEKEERPVAICGSLYLAGEIRPLILDYLKQ